MMPAQAPDFTYSCQASAEHFEQSAEFPLLRNRGLGPLAVEGDLDNSDHGRAKDRGFGEAAGGPVTQSGHL
jgi:hypothetical protein